MANQNVRFTFQTPVRMIWPSVSELKQPSNPQYTAQYDATLLLSTEHPEWAAFQQNMAAVAAARFPGRDFAALDWPQKAGEKHIADLVAAGKQTGHLDFLKGHILVKAHATAKRPPELFATRDDGQMTQFLPGTPAYASCGSTYFYSGVMVKVDLTIAPKEQGTKGPGVTLYINGIVSLRQGERLGGTSASRFEGYKGVVSAANPYGGQQHPYAPGGIGNPPPASGFQSIPV